MRRLIVLAAFLALALGAAVLPSNQATEAQGGCFTETGFCISNPAFLSYFNARGGKDAFGFPISREFSFLGFRVQFFQGHIMQLQPNGSVATMNLLDAGLMPVTRVNGSSFPGSDPALVAETPQVTAPNYAERIVEFIRANAPNEFQGQPVGFFNKFMTTVDLATAFPGGGGNPALLPLLNLEIWGSVTSRPLADPSNPGFIYQRFQRSIMHYRTECRCTERILLADWFKTVIVGTAPADLAADMAGSRFINQWSPGSPNWLARPNDLPDTDLTNAFVPDLAGYPTPPGAGPAPGPAPGPTATPVAGDQPPTITNLGVPDERVDPGETFTIRIEATDDKGIDIMWWWATSTSDDELKNTHEERCRGVTICRRSWDVNTTDTGTITIHALAKDTAGQTSAEVTKDIRVRSAGATATPTPAATATPTRTP